MCPRLLFRVCLLIMLPAFSQADSASSVQVNVGCLLPTSGPSAIYGDDSVAAIRMAVEELRHNYLTAHQSDNEGHAGNTLYPLIDVTFADTKSKPVRAVQLARQLIEKNKVNFLCGAVSSSVALAVTNVARDHKTIFVGSDHASPRLVDEAIHPYYYRMNNGTRQSMAAGAQYIAKNYSKNHSKSKPLRIAFIGPDYDYGYRAWDDLRYFLKREKVSFNIVSELWPSLNQKNYQLYLDALAMAKPDIIINGHWGQDFVDFIRQIKNTSLLESTQLMNFDAGGNYNTLAALGKDMPLGLVLSARHHVNWPDTQENRRFVEGFHQRTGRYPSYAAEGAYSAIHAIAAVVREAGSVDDLPKLIRAFKHLKIRLPEDPDGFKSYMDPNSHQILQVQAIGITVNNSSYPPAATLLEHWQFYHPPISWALP